MVINSVTMENWKCFLHRKRFQFKNGMNLITLQNGSGKTSMFQAILFALYGKMPTGFNFTLLKNDPTLQSTVEVEFEHNGDIYKAVKKFGNINTHDISILNDNGEWEYVAKGQTAVREWQDKILSLDLVQAIWTDSLIKNNVLTADYIHQKVLQEVLKDALLISKTYKAKSYATKQAIKREEDKIGECPYTLDELQEKVNNLMDELSSMDYSTSNWNSNDILKARTAQSAAKELESLGDPKMDEATLREVSSLDLDKLNDELLKELDKPESNISGLGFTSRILKNAIKYGESEEHCPLCNNKWTQETSEKLNDIINKGIQSAEEIEKLKEKIKLVKKYGKYIESDSHIYSLRAQVEKMPNYEEVLEQANEERDNKRKELNKLQDYLAIANKNKDISERIKELKEQYEDEKNKQKVCDDWITKASAYYSHEIMEHASDLLHKANESYHQIFLYDDTMSVAKDSESGLQLLHVAQMSNGEKTLVATSLVMAIRDLLIPDFPLLFDETFSALDEENLNQVKNLLNSAQGQNFVITHDVSWRRRWEQDDGNNNRND